MDKHHHIPYKPMGDYAGAEDLLKDEWDYLKKQHNGFNKNRIKGIALSGGGIRSASFCLGVMQALAANSKLEKFDYLSTVSGGGYLGGALSWLWSGLWRESDTSPEFGTGKDDFPFGTGKRQFKFNESDIGLAEEKAQNNRNQASLLRHLRQNGKYLTPGRGITSLSFISIILRSIVMGFITLMVLSGFAFSLLYSLKWFDVNATSTVFRTAVQGLLILYLGMHFFYMISIARIKKAHENTTGYKKRRWFESHFPGLMKGILGLGLLSAIHWAQVKLTLYVSIPEVGSLAAALGALLGSIGKESKWRKIINWIPHGLQLVLGAIFMLFGLLVLADYSIALLITQVGDWHILITSIAALVILGLARYLPVNNISIHRYYRDRLMESFMPDADKVMTGKENGEAVLANKAEVGDLEITHTGNRKLPYHLINTNVILVESKIAKFRGRGGDNFILSPLYSGSNATGWRKTREFCNGKITLPTAVAISGAAANPDSGVAGKGLTTNVVISLLMSIFNLRLGYWATNPDPQYQSNQGLIPSYFNPAFIEVFNRSKMNEEAEFVQLSDGGHFENLGLYELFRRRARLIVVCDAGADPDYEFADLANAIEKARVDFGMSIDLNRDQLQTLVPSVQSANPDLDYPLAQKSYLMANIDYHDGSKVKARLIYIKTTLTENVSADIHGYKRAHADFPDETTADQFFDEVQFEAYRELGWQITHEMLQDGAIAKVL